MTFPLVGCRLIRLDPTEDAAARRYTYRPAVGHSIAYVQEGQASGTAGDRLIARTAASGLPRADPSSLVDAARARPRRRRRTRAQQMPGKAWSWEGARGRGAVELSGSTGSRKRSTAPRLMTGHRTGADSPVLHELAAYLRSRLRGQAGNCWPAAGRLGTGAVIDAGGPRPEKKRPDIGVGDSRTVSRRWPRSTQSL